MQVTLTWKLLRSMFNEKESLMVATPLVSNKQKIKYVINLELK